MQNQSKTITISKPYNEILASIDRSTLVNAYFGGSNLLADYLNDYSSEGSNSFYIYANPWSNACCGYYIIRADSFQEAYSELLDTFESDFIIEDQEDVKEDTIYNDNGEPVNIDNLVFLGEIKLTE